MMGGRIEVKWILPASVPLEIPLTPFKKGGLLSSLFMKRAGGDLSFYLSS